MTRLVDRDVNFPGAAVVAGENRLRIQRQVCVIVVGQIDQRVAEEIRQYGTN